jgi:hypothetical protein
MDGSTLHNKIAKFRVIPYCPRKNIKLPDNIHELIDISEEGLKQLEESPEPEDKSRG